ncbi:ATP-dependent DNA helicase PIF1-like [Senna tora]|uniref:ATP-dependent DNA helicase n=1 Tax=Senna tora TaxID=362788 RepID=A0A834TQ33_9FABA|nr:ATP-dependent DNA helicase PIF1-like [Senna tora]
MVKSRCSKLFSKKFTDSISFDEEGYCKYRRHDSGHFIEKNGIKLDNRFIVSYNPTLLLRYQAHINVEFCNQSRSIKYLFKYVSKGHDKVTVAILWRIFGFDINFREPSVERLTFHLPNQQGVVFPDNAPIDSVVFNATVDRLIVFIKWHQVQDIKTIDDVVYPIFKDACYVMGLLDDDKEYIEGIIEGSKWSSDLHLDDDRVQEIALAEIENLLKINGHSLSDFPSMPMPNEALIRNIGNLLISEELNYDRNALKSEHAHLLSSLTGEQRLIYDTIMSVVNEERPIQGSDLAELMVHTKLIIWDEAPMAYRHCFEALDHTLTDIMHSQSAALAKHPFGGKVVVLGGDFRQILPVIPRAGREDIVLASLNSSYLWSSCKVLSSSKNMRLYQGYSVEENASISRFVEWILKVGEGNIGNIINDEEHEITIDDAENPIQAIVESTYPKLLDNFKNHVYFRQTAILSPTLDDVAQVNEFMLGLLPVYTTEFLNTICDSGLPYHQLKLKVGAPIMLLRNIDRSMGLCNGTRLILTRMCEHVIEASIMSGKFVGEKVLIARMLISPSDYKLPFKFQRRQFPVVLSFAMTFNKSQGQTLSNFGIYLPRPIFSHDQLYVAVSRVRKRSGLKIFVTDANRRQMRTTTNVVFKEIFQNVK